MLKDRNGSDDSSTRLRRVALLALAALTGTILLQIVIFFGLAGVPVGSQAVLLILAPAVFGVAALLVAARQG
jgi:hypothetical protein